MEANPSEGPMIGLLRGRVEHPRHCCSQTSGTKLVLAAVAILVIIAGVFLGLGLHFYLHRGGSVAKQTKKYQGSVKSSAVLPSHPNYNAQLPARVLTNMSTAHRALLKAKAPPSCPASAVPAVSNGKVTCASDPVQSGSSCSVACDSGFRVSTVAACDAVTFRPATCVPSESKPSYAAAQQFCQSRGFDSLTCGFASPQEETRTRPSFLPDSCQLDKDRAKCIGEPAPALPAELEWNPDPSDSNAGTRVFSGFVSLACKGTIVVRTAFKMLKQPTLEKESDRDGTDCASVRTGADKNFGGPYAAVVRCELELPATGGSEAERAIKAKHGKCWDCRLCSDDQGCPSTLDKWYSDSYTVDVQGCGFDPHKWPGTQMPNVRLNPGTKILLAKFEVCNINECSDPPYVKHGSVKSCVKGKCEQ